VGVGGCGNRPPIRMGTKRCQHVTGVRPFPRPLHSFLLLTPTQTQQWVISFFNVQCWQLAIVTHDSIGGFHRSAASHCETYYISSPIHIGIMSYSFYTHKEILLSRAIHRRQWTRTLIKCHL